MKNYALILFALLISISAKSQEATTPGETSAYKLLEKTVLQGTNKESVISKNIVITNADGDFFWPIYRQYNSKMEELTNEYIALYTSYIEKKDKIVFSEAMDLLEGMMDVDKDLLKLKKKYFKKMSDGMNPVKVASYFNYENELQLKMRLELIKELSESKE